jgi:hypothetical protein
MDELIKKLDYTGQANVFGINYPESFSKHLDSVSKMTTIRKEVEPSDRIEFAIAFAIAQQELNDCILTIAPQLFEDAVFWCCYPKGTSKKYNGEFNRDQGWEAMIPFGLKGVRIVSIDEDWSALRFRKSNYEPTPKSQSYSLGSSYGHII